MYPWPAADGEHGGSPHVHLACAEAYVVIGGQGRLETLDHTGHKVTPPHQGDVVWFTSGTIHRAVNDGDLQVLVVMQNSGLPEVGDAVMAFPSEYPTPEKYASAACVLGADGGPDEARARVRRDLALEGFAELTRAWRLGDRSAFERFCRSAADIVRPRPDAWQQTVETGALAAAHRTLRQIGALRTGDWSHLANAEVTRIVPPQQSLGMCGHLHAYDQVRRTAGPEPRDCQP